MSQPLRVSEAERDRPDSNIASVIDSIVLMKGSRELLIRHGTETYRLRITASNKLILTK